LFCVKCTTENGQKIELKAKKKIWIKATIQGIKPWKIIHAKTTKCTAVACNIQKQMPNNFLIDASILFLTLCEST
jgi:hypothetical protein